MYEEFIIMFMIIILNGIVKIITISKHDLSRYIHIDTNMLNKGGNDYINQ